MRIALSVIILVDVWLGSSHLVVAQQPRYGVTVKAVKPAALAKARTYVWTTSLPSFDKRVDALIVAAVDRELGARGLTKLPSGRSDVVVTYASVSRTDADVKSAPKNGASREFAVGTLVVDLSDPTTSELIFRVRMDTPIERDPATIEAAVNTAVAAMFDKYPRPPKR